MPSEPSLAEVRAALAADGYALPAGPVRIDRYGDSEALSDELLALIRGGRKRGGTSLFWAYAFEGVALPRVGDLEVVLDHRGAVALVTRLVSVEVLSFGDVTAAQAAIEGEGDGSLAHWRDAHRSFFARECARIGRVPADDMPVVFSAFELLHVRGAVAGLTDLP